MRGVKDAKPRHFCFWEPFEGYWTKPDEPTVVQGFPCFCAFQRKAVAIDSQEDEASGNILEALIYMYPSNIPILLQESLIRIVSSFSVFSYLNLGSFPLSLSWTDSELAVRPMQLSNGDHILFVLKMPNFFSSDSVVNILNQTVNAYEMFCPLLRGKFPFDQIHTLREILSEWSIILSKFTFSPKFCLSDQLSYSSRPIESFGSRAALAIATQLIDFTKSISEKVIGIAVLYRSQIIISTIDNKLLSLHSVYKALAKKKSDDFATFDIWIDSEGIQCTLAVFLCNHLTFLAVIGGQGECVAESVKKIGILLSNGMDDFSADCELYKNVKSDSGVIAFWPEIGTVKRSKCSRSGLRRMGEIHEEMAKNEVIKEIVTMDGKLGVAGVRMVNMEGFVQAKMEGRGQPVPDLYGRLKRFVPNLPVDVQ
jgi:hypothetical protein